MTSATVTCKGNRRLRCLKWFGALVCLLIVWHFLVVATTGGVVVLRFGSGWEVGSNGVTSRLLWTRGGDESIAWDCVGSTPRCSIKDDRVFVQLPLYIPFLVVGAFTVYLFWRERRRFKPVYCDD